MLKVCFIAFKLFIFAEDKSAKQNIIILIVVEILCLDQVIRATLWAVLAMYKDHPVERNTSPSLHLKRYQDSKQKHRNTLQGEMYVNKYTKQGGHWSTCLEL